MDIAHATGFWDGVAGPGEGNGGGDLAAPACHVIAGIRVRSLLIFLARAGVLAVPLLDLALPADHDPRNPQACR